MGIGFSFAPKTPNTSTSSAGMNGSYSSLYTNLFGTTLIKSKVVESARRLPMGAEQPVKATATGKRGKINNVKIFSEPFILPWIFLYGLG